ncbi:MAG: hypothetical protein ACI3XT_04935, partial [Butyricicoccaceae bacterium]
MKKLVKLLSLTLVFMLAFSLMAACGGGDDSGKTDGNDGGDKTASGSGVQSQNKANDLVVIATANEP